LDTREIDTLSGTYTLFVLSMVMASFLVAPTIIGTTQALTAWRLLKKAGKTDTGKHGTGEQG
jgi:predicted membrane protein